MELTFSNTVVIVVLSVVILLTLVGNMLVIAAVATTRRMRTVTNYFVVSLAVSDLLVGFLVMPFGVMQEVAHRWQLGRIACEFWISLDVLLCTASILNLCCISLDRYFAITSPMSYVVKRNSKLAVVMIAGVWVLSALITCPPIFGWHESDRENSSGCGYNTNVGYVVYSALGSFFIPAFVMLYVYYRIFAAARKRESVLTSGVSIKKKIDDGQQGNSSCHSSVGDHTSSSLERSRSHRNTDPAVRIDISPVSIDQEAGLGKTNDKGSDKIQNLTLAPSISRIPSVRATLILEKSCDSDRGLIRTYSSNESRETSFSSTAFCRGLKIQKDTWTRRQGYEKAAFQRERRVAKSLSVVVGGFVLCWLPFFILYIIRPFCTYEIPQELSSCLVWLGWVNSAINPFIYALNSTDYKKAFARLTIDKLRRPTRTNIKNFI
ncbi:5-hydroxytryptamine receptor 1F-like [Limulus polyphemus]|uniref:5-hydroxytryptamine receptor 1F-like n=1 Tax=Limulus polyphemus TaxID=6850 RepID=A0ABM1BEJ2_LIMPO|nr:5-hydroxytryptamine receptor 1F-like [Limulus polyphemus]XP_022248274.1 5-hydroxytryptamine receptor 1F-like [Limulus polyphemus]